MQKYSKNLDKAGEVLRDDLRSKTLFIRKVKGSKR